MNTRESIKITNEGILQISDVLATDLVEKYGTPLYVIDNQYIENICKCYTESLKKYYKHGGYISYASKAFCCKEIYRIIDKFDMHADVVSAGELHTALKAGFLANKLTFHGNNKTEFELKYALENNIGNIVIDSYSEIDEIDELCKDMGKIQEVSIRVNPGIEAHTHHYIQTAKIDSKFGFSIENGDAAKVIEYVLSKSNLKLSGLHCHIGSQIFEVKSFILAVDKMTDFYLRCKKQFNYSFTKLNLGGGFGIYYSNDDKKMTLDDYAEYIHQISDKLMACVESKNIYPPQLILEPGRSIVGEAGLTLYTIGNIKEISGIKNYISIDGGMFENPRYALYQAKYSFDVANKMKLPKTISYSIAGKCCESGDLIGEDILLPECQKGDILVAYSTGAYNYSMASNYNRNLIPQVVSVKNGTDKVIIKGQTLDDLIKNDL